MPTPSLMDPRVQAQFISELDGYDQMLVRMFEMSSSGVFNPEVFILILESATDYAYRLREKILEGNESQSYYENKLGCLRGLISATALVGANQKWNPPE